MRFIEAYGEWNAGRLTQAEAGLILGLCERSFRRYLSRYEVDGLAGLIDQRLDAVSNRRAPVDEVMALTNCTVLIIMAFFRHLRTFRKTCHENRIGNAL